ncbi:hypothetical protein C7M84_010454 [Penaeus vannamei]|uniref:Uncharacterized protein n=1 Tax=Penaeus vannamei TaxID=6689 RepID=A0A3R7Q8F2_PENVA|nr:hypothetical protein C7M84_010454 [Penaeus vannamei]
MLSVPLPSRAGPVCRHKWSLRGGPVRLVCAVFPFVACLVRLHAFGLGSFLPGEIGVHRRRLRLFPFSIPSLAFLLAVLPVALCRCVVRCFLVSHPSSWRAVSHIRVLEEGLSSCRYVPPSISFHVFSLPSYTGHTSSVLIRSRRHTSLCPLLPSFFVAEPVIQCTRGPPDHSPPPTPTCCSDPPLFPPSPSFLLPPSHSSSLPPGSFFLASSPTNTVSIPQFLLLFPLVTPILFPVSLFLSFPFLSLFPIISPSPCLFKIFLLHSLLSLPCFLLHTFPSPSFLSPSLPSPLLSPSFSFLLTSLLLLLILFPLLSFSSPLPPSSFLFPFPPFSSLLLEAQLSGISLLSTPQRRDSSAHKRAEIGFEIPRRGAISARCLVLVWNNGSITQTSGRVVGWGRGGRVSRRGGRGRGGRTLFSQAGEGGGRTLVHRSRPVPELREVNGRAAARPRLPDRPLGVARVPGADVVSSWRIGHILALEESGKFESMTRGQIRRPFRNWWVLRNSDFEDDTEGERTPRDKYRSD